MTRARDLASGSGIEAGEIVPHIIPGVLYPAVANIMVDGSTALSAVTTGPNSSTVASSKYGTVQSDGRMYYYTDIKGSKPIKDPRIGAHFGSQRHKTKSLQILEQETATQGANVYSVDGREWMRLVEGPTLGVTNPAQVKNNDNGQYIGWSTGFMEITGYFIDVNFINSTNTDEREFTTAVDGGSASSARQDFMTSTGNPLGGARFVDSGNVANLGLGLTLGIHTLKIATTVQSEGVYNFGIELIAQDKFTDATCDYNNDPTITHDANTKILAGMFVSGTGIPAGATVASVTSTTEFELSASTTGGAVTNGTLTFTTEDIQIPSQNVVSFGKKFTVSGTPHYDPFAFKTDGTTAWASGAHNGTSWPVGTGSSANIDTATSLGLSNWLHSSNYYKPYNGGRVVVWVASDGTIKTSVNVMPPNARSIGNSSSLTNATAKANASIANNTFYPTMEAGTIDHSQAEVAKTFNGREFGNGSANGGTGHASYADASMLSTTNDDIAYVMDDGLTSLSGHAIHFNAATPNSVRPQNAASDDGYYLTFIGTGFSYNGNADMATSARHDTNLVQNLPYGTHIVQILRTGSSNVYTIKVDGVLVLTTVSGTNDNLAGLHECTFHQPKMPPIPEDAVVIADYMLMADYVAQTDAENTEISKGVRGLSGSRDVFYNGAFYDSNNNSVVVNTTYLPYGFSNFGSAASNPQTSCTLPFFGSNVDIRSEAGTTAFNGGSNVTHTTLDNSAGSWGDMKMTANPGITLGLNTVVHTLTNGGYRFIGYQIATPIHTSHHYQTFETPFLHELVGGDRNMEQHNLIVTPDGKTWDEVTRDTSYIGNMRVHAAIDENFHSTGTTFHFDYARGTHPHSGNSKYGQMMIKDFAQGYDRHICLVSGWYEIVFGVTSNDAQNANAQIYIKINGVIVDNRYLMDSDYFNSHHQFPYFLERGDYIQCEGVSEVEWNNFHIKKI